MLFGEFGALMERVLRYVRRSHRQPLLVQDKSGTIWIRKAEGGRQLKMRVLKVALPEK